MWPVETILAKEWAKALTVQWTKFFDSMTFKWFWEEHLIQRAQAEAKAKIARDVELEKWNLEINKIKIENEFILMLEHAEKTQEYNNMFWVLWKAQNKIEETAEGNIDPDKMKRLKDISKEFSSEEMQEYIAWILAWEYNTPWSYSLQTMEIIKMLSKKDIELFKKFTKIMIDNKYIVSKPFSSLADMNKLWIYLDDLNIIQSLWLIMNLDVNQSYNSINTENYNIISIYYWWKMRYFKHKWNKNLKWLYSLTRTWKEFVKLIGEEKSEEATSYIENIIKSSWFEIVTNEELPNFFN